MVLKMEHVTYRLKISDPGPGELSVVRSDSGPGGTTQGSDD